MKRLAASAILISLCTLLGAQTATVKDTVMRTYAYSDPDKAPRTGKIYPYNRYQTFSQTGEDVTWKMVVLENKWLRVKIFPQIGGKIWSIYDKKDGKEMFYDNGVVKFRDIALRGPWTSGGIEFNYGIIGHAPSCAAPVDYKVETKADGSVSCYIGVQELLTRTRWMVEINLPKDAVWVRTRTFWHNYSGLYQPYYHWANSGVTASEDLRLIYPATYTIAHGGQTTPFPIDGGHDYSKYSDQKFGADKSLHPGGSHKGYFGTYWENDDFGMVHFAQRDEKLGRKYFTWAPSEQGSIWVGLLTDDNPQYVELQSGRLFNQNMDDSNDTPYKQFLFTPYGTDEWNEYWLPFAKIGGLDDMTLRAVVNVSEKDGTYSLGIYPLQDLSGELVVKDAQGKVLASGDVNLKAAEPFNESARLSGVPALVTVGGARIWSSDTQETDRPHVINSEFDKNSAQGKTVYARCHIGMALYDQAEKEVDEAIAENPSILEALEMKAMLRYRVLDFEGCYKAADKALAIDAYDPQANYISGLAAWKMGKVYDAMDRLEIAALTSELRSAACTKLAEIHFSLGEKDLAAEYARKSLVGNAYDMTSLQLLYQCTEDPEVLKQIESLDPLSHFPAAEKVLAGKMTAEEMDESIFEEMKWQNYLEFASWYHSIGLDKKALAILDASKVRNALLSIWSAWLKGDTEAVKAAENESIEFVFPFRAESYAPLKWAVENGGGWRSRYLLAMLSDFLGNKEEAKALVSGNDSDYAPYYSYRYSLTGERSDVEKARELDPQEWRYVRDLTMKFLQEKDAKKAVEVVAPYWNKHKDNVHVADPYVQALMADGQWAKADKVMAGMVVLPFEGQSATHDMYRNIKLELARQALGKKQYKQALKYVDEARLWPTHLGVGKPYDYLIDTSREDALEAEIRSKMK